MFDAYSVKKIAPRILIGIILINLSLYLVVAATEVTRITARGAGSMLTQPFVDSNAGLNFTIRAGGVETVIGAAGILTGGYFLGKAALNSGAGISELFNGIFRAGRGNSTSPNSTQEGGVANRQGSFGKFIHMLFFMIVVPFGIILLAVLITLIFRQGLLIFLAVVAPIACALYILPSTDKYFKKWWELFSKTLLMYPIIMVIFAMSDILASIIFKSNQSLPGLIAGLIAMFAPLALIPFSFKFAGGAMTAIYGAITTGRGKLGEMGPLKQQREKAKEHWQSNKVQGMARQRREASGKLDRLKELEDKKQTGALAPHEQAELDSLKSNSWRYRRRMNRVGVDVLQREAELNKKASDLARLIIDNGDDERFRAATATLQEEVVKDAAGNAILDASGNVQTRKVWKSLAGKEFNEEQVMASRRAMGNNQYLMQQAMAHEMSKAMYEEDHDSLVGNLATLQAQMGISDATMNSALIGAGFQMKGKSLQWKRMVNETDANGNIVTKFDAGGMNDETHANIGTWAGIAQDHDSWAALTMAAERAIEVVQSTTATVTEKEDAVKFLHTVRANAQGLKSQIAQNGGDTAAVHAMALQQTGQDAQPGGSASAARAINDLIALMDHTEVDTTTPGAPTVTITGPTVKPLTNAMSDIAVNLTAERTKLQSGVASATGTDKIRLQDRINEITQTLNNPAELQAQAQADIDKAQAENQRIADIQARARDKAAARGGVIKLGSKIRP